MKKLAFLLSFAFISGFLLFSAPNLIHAASICVDDTEFDIVAFGDSNTTGFNVPSSWFALLESNWTHTSPQGTQFEFTNLGVGGATLTSSPIIYSQTSVYTNFLTNPNTHADIGIVLLGTNDAFFTKPINEFESSLDSFLMELNTSGKVDELLILSIPPMMPPYNCAGAGCPVYDESSNPYVDYIQPYNQMLSQIDSKCSTLGLGMQCGYLDATSSIPRNYSYIQSSDGVHMTTQAHTALSNLVSQYFASNYVCDQVPGSVTPVGPTGAHLTGNITFEWQEEPNTTTYELYIAPPTGGTPYHNQNISAASVCSGGVCSFQAPYTFGAGNYSWYILGKSSQGAGPWSAATTFSFVAPTQPVLNNPSSQVVNSDVVFSWQGGLGAQWIRLYVTEYVNGAAGTIKLDKWFANANLGESSGPTFSCSGGVCTLESGLDLTNGNYIWYVQPWSPFGYGTWSAGKQFSTFTQLPGEVTKTAPAGSSPLSPSGFVWEQTALATAYEFYLAKADGTSPLHVPNIEGSSVCDGSTCIYVPNYTFTAGSYNWWVRAKNAGGSGGWGSPLNFSLIAAAQPVLVSPNTQINNEDITFEWNESLGAQWVRLYVASFVNGAAATVKLDKWYGDASLGQTSNSTFSCNSGVCTINSDLDLANGNYIWFLQPWSPFGYGAWSAGMQFSTFTELPSVAEVTSPAGNSYASPTSVAWTEDPLATHYEVYLQRLGGSNPLHLQNISAASACNAGTCSVDVSTYAFVASDYQIWTRAKNTGGYGAWSGAFTFKMQPPQATSQVSPIAGPHAPGNTSISWQAVTGAQWYRVWIARTNGTVVLDKWVNATSTELNLAAGDYIWHVQTWSPFGYGPWTGQAQFTIGS